LADIHVFATWRTAKTVCFANEAPVATLGCYTSLSLLKLAITCFDMKI
jgi:hypothetical protein